jgi:DNA-binding NarL/FixJ family response regulator
VRVVIAEDSVLLREGLTRLLAEAGHDVVAAASEAEEFLRQVGEHQPDVVVVDVRMPPTFTDEGLRAALVVRSTWPGVGVLVLSQYVEERYATELLSDRPQGVGYLLKDRVADLTEFLGALDRVAAQGSALDPEVVAQLLARSRHPLAALTPRELDVLGLMAEGRSNAAIAAELVVSDGAVEKHINNIFAKLGLPPATVTTGGSSRCCATWELMGHDRAVADDHGPPGGAGHRPPDRAGAHRVGRAHRGRPGRAGQLSGAAGRPGARQHGQPVRRVRGRARHPGGGQPATADRDGALLAHPVHGDLA